MARPRIIPKSKMEVLKQQIASLLSSMGNSRALNHTESNYWQVRQITSYWCTRDLCKTQTLFFHESMQRARSFYLEALRVRAKEIEQDMLNARNEVVKK